MNYAHIAGFKGSAFANAMSQRPNFEANGIDFATVLQLMNDSFEGVGLQSGVRASHARVDEVADKAPHHTQATHTARDSARSV